LRCEVGEFGTKHLGEGIDEFRRVGNNGMINTREE